MDTDELIFHIMDFDPRGTDRINFVRDGVKIETSLYCGQRHRSIIKDLIKRKIIKTNGEVNKKELDVYYSLYNEDYPYRVTID